MKSDHMSNRELQDISRRKRGRPRPTISDRFVPPTKMMFLTTAGRAFISSSMTFATTGSSPKPFVRGQDAPPSHLLRNNPLRTASSGTRTNGVGQPSRNVGFVVDDTEDAQVMFRRRSEAFLGWCYREFNIDSSMVEIQLFQYHDYVRAMEDRIDIFCEDCYGQDESDESGLIYDNNDVYDDDHIFNFEDDDRVLSVTDYPTVPVRGLAAKQDIEVGQVVIAIPHRAMWTLHNVIDSDPVLVKVMGKQVREQMGWDTQMDEIPLLAVALLYQLQQVQQKHDARAESKFGPYLQILQDQQHDLQRSIPHLWSSAKLRKKATPGIRRVAKGIQRDVMEMYETIVMVLVEEHSSVFGEPYEASADSVSGDDAADETHSNDDDDDGNLTTGEKRTHHVAHESRLINENGDEWMFSLERFHWAFALVNSRHWHLPVPETDDPITVPLEDKQSNNSDVNGPSPSSHNDKDDNTAFNDQPPASMPTDEWMQHQREEHRKEEERESRLLESDAGVVEQGSLDPQSIPPASSFLAPVADLLNFGPPCTKGRYNYTTHVFEIVATCPFRKGQEITFWYTDACEDVFMANYGFTMPMMVPKCANLKDEASAKVKHLTRDLAIAYQELDRLDSEVDGLLTVLHECHCENQTDLLAGRKVNGNGGGSPPKAPSAPMGSRKGRNYSGGGPKGVSGRGSDGGSRNDARHAIRGRSRRSSKGSTNVKSRKSEF